MAATLLPPAGHLVAPSHPATPGADHALALLYHALVTGTTSANQTVAATLRDIDGGGRVLGDGAATAGPDGRFEVVLADQGGAPVRIRPGCRLLLSFGTQPATDLVVPDMTARVDAAHDLVQGVALPGAPITITVTGAPAATQVLAAGADGHFRGELGGRYDIVPGTTGEVIAGRPDGHAFALRWAAAQVTVTLDRGSILGVGASGQTVSLQVQRGSFVVARAAGVVGDDAAQVADVWQLEARDEGGRSVPLLPLDRLEVDAAGDHLEMQLDEVTVEASAAADSVAGRGPPGAALHICVRRGDEGASRDGAVDADGSYLADLAPDWDLRVADAVTVTARLADDSALLQAVESVPGLTLDLESGALTGFVFPGASVSASLVDGAAPVASGMANASQTGRFALQLRLASGEPALPVAGEDLLVRFASRQISMTVPLLTVQPDVARDTVSGQATPGGTVRIRAGEPFALAQQAVTRESRPGADGYYEVSFAALLDVAPGGQLTASYLAPSGDESRIERRLASLYVQRGGTEVSGSVAANSALTVTLARGGALLGRETAQSLSDGAFDVVLDTGPDLGAISPADVVTVAWSAGLAAQPPGVLRHEVADISGTLDVTNGVVRGHGPARRPIDISARDTGDGGLTTYLTATTDETGAFSRTVPAAPLGEPLRAGSRYEIACADVEGNRTFLRLVAPQLTVTIDRGDVAGMADPLGDAGIGLYLGDREIGSGIGRADTFGAFRTLLRSGIGEAAVRPSHEVRLVDTAGQSARLPVPPLSIRLDAPAHLVEGSSPPSATLEVRLTAPAAPSLSILVRSAATGHWSVRDADLPPRAPFDLGSVRNATARLTVGNGHLVIADSDTPSATPTSEISATPTPEASRTATPAPGRSLYLPWLGDRGERSPGQDAAVRRSHHTSPQLDRSPPSINSGDHVSSRSVTTTLRPTAASAALFTCWTMTPA